MRIIKKLIMLMTLKELLKQVGFDELLLYLKEHEPDHLDNIYAFRRFSANETTVFIMNCSDKPHSFFWSSTAHIRLLLDSGDQKYGGSNNSAKENAHSVNGKVHIILPPLSARIYLEY